jgi:AcrR family transcriptional regulator
VAVGYPARQPHDGGALRSAPLLGVPSRQRVVGSHGLKTARRLLEAALAEFDERGFHAVSVADVARRARTSHGTFYLYFSNKEDLFKALMRDTLHDMKIIAGDFPVVSADDAGRAALRAWVQRFAETYAAHAVVIRVLSHADIVGETIWGDGLGALLKLAEAITTGMIAGRQDGCEQSDEDRLAQHGELTALACVMMLERVNYLISIGIKLPEHDMADRLSEIIYAAFRPAQLACRSACSPASLP